MLNIASWKYRRILSSAVAVILFAAFTACGDSDSSNEGNNGNATDRPAETTSSAAAVSLGPVANAAVVAFRADHLVPDVAQSEQRSAVLAAAVTNNNGIATRLDLGDYSGPVLYAVIVVDQNTSYYDDASKTTVQIPSNTFYSSGHWFAIDVFFPPIKYAPAVFGDSRAGARAFGR